LVGGAALINLDKGEFAKAVQEFGERARGASVALFYYAGHGVQVDGINYLVPTTANLTKASDVDFELVSSKAILDEMQDSGAAFKVLIFDACRNDPFVRVDVRGFRSGLAQMHAPVGTLIAYATQPGNVASDGNGKDSPYTQALVEAMRRPGLDVFETFNAVGLTVEEKTMGQQRPWMTSSPLEGDFRFNMGSVS